MRDPDEQQGGKRILFWTDMSLPTASSTSMVASLVRGLADAAAHQGWIGRNPKDWITDAPTANMKRDLAAVLRMGKRGIAYMGKATCRLCTRELGNADLYGFGYIWPELAEHYILDHKVWTPECSALLSEVQKRKKAAAREAK